MPKSVAEILCTVLPLLSLGACGGGGGGGGSIAFIPPAPATPTPTSSPIPPAPPPPTVALLAPEQTAGPPSPVADPTGPQFSNGTVFPLLLTAVSDNGNGDITTTHQGGTLTVSSGDFTLTLNNPALGVTNAPMNALVLPPNGRPVIVLSADGLAYTRFGYWTLPSTINAYYDRSGGAFLGGYVTPSSGIPVTGSVSYSGHVVGLYSTSVLSGGPEDLKELAGNVSLLADFGARSLSGSMSNLHFTDSAFADIPLNTIGLSATIDTTHNFFTGAIQVTSIGDPTYGFTSNASGSVGGRFFGPSAQEIGAVWTLQDSAHRVIGSFGASRP